MVWFKLTEKEVCLWSFRIDFLRSGLIFKGDFLRGGFPREALIQEN